MLSPHDPSWRTGRGTATNGKSALTPIIPS
jgi:hypothetical protein